MEIPSYDVCILGGGPAGTATALSLLKYRPDLRVAVVERAGYDQLRIGETLPPNARSLLEQLDVWPAFIQAGHLPAYGTSAAWGSSALHANETVFSLHGYGWHLDRRAFDAFLAQVAIQRGAEVYLGTRLMGFQQLADESWQLTLLRPDGGPLPLHSRFVVDATGRLAWFSRQQGAKRTLYDELAGAAVLFKTGADVIDTYVLVEACSSGWWYSALLPGSRMVVMYMSDADTLRRYQLRDPTNWLEQARQTEHTWARCKRAEPLMRPFTHAAHTQALYPVARRGWLAAGDAASTFDPLSGQGIYKALHSGIFASYAILDWLKGQDSGLERYAALQKAEFKQYLTEWKTYYSLEQRWPDVRFWKHRQEVCLEESPKNPF